MWSDAKAVLRAEQLAEQRAARHRQVLDALRVEQLDALRVQAALAR